jgi:hypothetical protein
MIALRNDCLLVAKEDGGFVPCSIEQLTLEVVGGAADAIDPEWLRQAAASVLHYFKTDLGRTHVTVEEFAEALTRVLAGLGLTAEVADIKTTPAGPVDGRIWRADLRQIAVQSGKLGELGFLQHLREEFRQGLQEEPSAVEFLGLRGCVKQLAGRKHWCPACDRLQGWIIDSLRSWYGQEIGPRRIALVIH